MPEYLFLNNDTGDEYLLTMSISQLDEYLKENPSVTQLVYGAPMVGTNTLVGNRSKPDSGFRDVLKRIKKANRRSTINTF